jgi:TetR/AcrR family acrAB operon transcriptional repressor
MMRRTKEEAEQTKQSILDAALTEFADKGYVEAKLVDIASRASVTKGAIFFHFKGKQHLYEAINDRVRLQLDTMIENSTGTADSPFEKLINLLYAVLDNFYDDETFRKFIELTWYKSGSRQYSNTLKFKSGFVESFLERMQTYLSEAQQAGQVRDSVDSRISALHFSSLINGIYRVYFVAPSYGRSKRDAIKVFQEHLATIATPDHQHLVFKGISK